MRFKMDKAIELRSQCKHFRILVIGRANAGKTTLLKKVCNSIVDPEIRSESGEKIDTSTLHGSEKFIFHDSRGFESGSDLEVNTITDFIAKQAATHSLSEQLHAIWYCLPTDTTRPLLAADEKFFSARVTGRGESSLVRVADRTQFHNEVPVIAIFTKLDGLITEAFTELLDDGHPPQAAMEMATEKAERMLVDNFETPLTLTKFPLADRVRLDDMRTETNSCNELIAKTANALSDDTLRLLFVSVQQNNIYLSVHYAVDSAWDGKTIQELVKAALAYFPHVYFDNVDACVTILERKCPRMEESLLRDSGRSELLAAICICAEQTFRKASANEAGFSPAFSAALDAYLVSSLQEDVNREIAAASDQDYKETEFVEKLVETIKSHPLRIHS
ncbi:hypothetical protein DFH09DRAFT_1325148 [Mycena vulgaris]|nr:hypothetical protein DFH09DRAFT_1325148 [Mycena vulgaris]